MTDPNDLDRLRHLMMSALDGELSSEEERQMHASLERNPSAQAEWDQLRSVQEVTRTMNYRAPSDRVWQEYWSSVYSRIERGIGWILVSIGAIVLLSWGTWQLVRDLISADLVWYLKGAISALLIGFVILLVSVIREKLFTQRKNPYKDVNR